MSELRAMVKQSSHYFIAYALTMAASFISFPVYTRLLSVSDYGVLGVISTTVFFVMAAAKMGVQNAIIRFHEEVKQNTMGVSLRSYYSTLVFGPVFTVALGCILYALIIYALHPMRERPEVMSYFLLSAVWVFFLCSNTILKNFLRAEQNTALFNVINVIAKFFSLIVGVGLVYFVFKSLMGLFLAFLITECIIFVYLMLRLSRQQRISLKYFDLPFFKRSLAYGLPLVGSEMTSIILNSGDRYVILFYMSTAAVGMYSAGYDLAMSVMESLIFPLSFAIVPLYVKIHAQKGKEVTGIFLSNCLRYFMMAALPALFGLNMLGREITVLIASQKYEHAYAVIPYVSWGVLAFGLSSIFNAGLFIEKKNAVITYWTVIAGVFNIALNFVLIPRMGFVGSALATLVAYVLLFAVLAVKSFKYLPFMIDYANIGKYLAFSVVMALVIGVQHYGKAIISLPAKISSGFLVYTLLVLVFDREIRERISLSLSGKEIVHETV